MNFNKCQLCNNYYDLESHLPRMMPDCGHTFCQTCIVSKLELNQAICPSDRFIQLFIIDKVSYTYRNYKSIYDFPINQVLLEILKKNNKNRNNQSFEASYISQPPPSLSTNSYNDEEIKSLLTPPEFLQKILGTKKKTETTVQKNQIQLENSFPSFKKNSVEQNYAHYLVNQEQIKLEQKIETKFESIFTKLQERKNYVLKEVKNIFQDIYDKFENIKNDDLLAQQIPLVCQKITVEFQLQLELMIARYCNIKQGWDSEKISQMQVPHFKESLNSSSDSDHPKYPQSFVATVAKDPHPIQPNHSEQFTNSFLRTEPHSKNTILNNYVSELQSPAIQSPTPQKQYQKHSPTRRIFDDSPLQVPINFNCILQKNQLSIPKQVFLPNNSLEKVNNTNSFSQEKINKSSPFQQILEKLQKGVKMENIDLKNQNLGDKEIQQLTSLNLNTKFLQLSRNQISDQGFQYLLQNNFKNKNLKTIKLKNNKLTEKSLDYLIQSLQLGKSNNLKELYLKGNLITVQKHIQKLTQIQQLGVVIFL